MKPEEPELVPMALFKAAVTALLGLVAQTQVLANGLALILKERGIVTPELWAQFADEAELAKQAQIVRQAIQSLDGHPELIDLLKDFEGPLQ